MKSKLREIPDMRSEEAERKFWAKADSTEYVDWKSARRTVFPELKPSLKTISIRIPETMLMRLRAMANERDVPYQSLIKIILAERLAKDTPGHGKRAAPGRRR
jgi:predicted DNA binding CopG/RHH family protein